MESETLKHTLPPVYDVHSRVLMLGSFPSPTSRAPGFYYGHPQNRFWRVLAEVLGEPLPTTNESKRLYRGDLGGGHPRGVHHRPHRSQAL